MRVHPGIRIDRIPVEGWVGLLWGTVILVRTIIDVPDARWFLPRQHTRGSLWWLSPVHLWRTRQT